MRALVTGARGFVGKFLIAHLLECGDQVLATDLSSAKWIENNPAFGKGTFDHENLQHQSLDVSIAEDCQIIINKFKPDVIYHLAGISFVPQAEDNFNNALLVNVGAVNNIIRTCHLLENKARVIFISSAEVYGRMALQYLPLKEETPLLPANNYSLSKAMAELVAARYAQFGHVIPVVMRPFNHVGPGQDPRFVVASFASQLAAIANGKQKPLISVGNLEACRDFSDVRDIVRAYRMAGIKGSGVYNLCSGVARSIQSILDDLIRISGLKVEIQKDQERMRAAEVPQIYGSYAKAQLELNWRPEISFEQTLVDTYQYFLES
jgi:GDP-4-dehydro-6-deoxy-D-mannose reductase